MREIRPSTLLGESLLQEWGHWCIQYLETFGCGGAAATGDGDRRVSRSPGDYSNPVLAGLIGSEAVSGINQTLHLQIAERPAIDRRVALLRYVGKPLKLPEWGGEPVIWRGEIEIGGGHRGLIEFPEPERRETICAPPLSPASIGNELGIAASEVREATRRLRALAVRVYRRANVKRKAA